MGFSFWAPWNFCAKFQASPSNWCQPGLIIWFQAAVQKYESFILKGLFSKSPKMCQQEGSLVSLYSFRQTCAVTLTWASAGNISANHRRPMLTFVPYHVYIISLLATFHIQCLADAWGHLQPFSSSIFHRSSETVSVRDCGDQTRYFRPNHYFFLTLTKWVLCVNQTRTQARNRKFNLLKREVATYRIV